jgi:hypothetical protein
MLKRRAKIKLEPDPLTAFSQKSRNGKRAAPRRRKVFRGGVTSIFKNTNGNNYGTAI